MARKQHEAPAAGSRWDDRDPRHNRRVEVVEVWDPQGTQFGPYVRVRNVGGAYALEAGVPAPAPVGKLSTVKLSRWRSSYRPVVTGPDEP